MFWTWLSFWFLFLGILLVFLEGGLVSVSLLLSGGVGMEPLRLICPPTGEARLYRRVRGFGEQLDAGLG